MFKAINTKILVSGGVILAAAALIIGGTFAFFSDTETSTGNSFTAGAIDLKVSSHYSDYVGQKQGFDAKDLNGDVLFTFADMKPGDMGGGNFDIIATSNPYWACMKAKIDTTPENLATEPEVSAGDSPSDTTGELQNYLSFYLWNDIDGNGAFTPNDTTKDRNLVGPYTLAELETVGYLPLADSTAASFFSSTAILPDITKNLGYKYCFGTWGANPATAGLSCLGTGDQNRAQTDGVTGSIEFYAVQSRNNTSFTCASMNTPEATVTVNTGWSEVDLDELGGGHGKEWFAKARNNDITNFEVAVGTNDGIPSGYNSADTTWIAGASNPFTLSYNGAGNASFTAGGQTVNYVVGTTGYGRIGVDVKAPNAATTTVNSLSLSVATLSTDNVSVTEGTNHLTISGVNLDQAWTLTGNFIFSAVGAGTGFSQENPAVQFSID